VEREPALISRWPVVMEELPVAVVVAQAEQLEVRAVQVQTWMEESPVVLEDLRCACVCLVMVGNVFSDGNVSVVSGEVRTHSADGVTMQKVREVVCLE
jgi:hypothetical protein